MHVLIVSVTPIGKVNMRVNNIQYVSDSFQIDKRKNLNTFVSNSLYKQILGLAGDVFQPSFGNAIPKEKIFKLGRSYLDIVVDVKNEDSLYDIAKSYFYDEVLSLLSALRSKSNSKHDITRLFRHELINSASSPFEFDFNPSLKNFNENLVNCDSDRKYLAYQKKSFRKLVTNVNNITSYWTRLENWQKNPKTPVNFSVITEQLKSAVEFSNHQNAPVSIKDYIGDTKESFNAFELYNLLSQVVLNGVKYSSGKPVFVEFSKADTGAAEKYIMTVLNKDTKPIPDSDIDKILKGSGYRSSIVDVDGSGTGYKEIIQILQKHNRMQDIPSLIEKGRKKGVKVTVPFDLVNLSS